VFYTADELSGLILEHFGELRRRQLLFLTYDIPRAAS